MNNKKTVVIIIMCMALVLSFTMLVSYAYWKVSQTQTGTNNINGACLSIRLEQYYDENDNLIEGFSLDNAWPITDHEGSSGEGYSFKVVNECEEDLTYQVILDSLPESGGRINPEFVKVELDDRAIRRYDSLEDAPETDEYLTIAQKKVYTGTILGNDEVEHTIKLWISSDSTNDDIGKSFSGKVRVMAGQQIVQSSDLTLKILSETGEPDATVNNLHVGDRVGYGTEQFYVIGIDGNNVRLLSRYLINVGDYTNPNVSEGLQSAQLGLTRTDVSDPSSATNYGAEYTYNDCEYDENDECIEGTLSEKTDFINYGSTWFSNGRTTAWRNINFGNYDDTFIYDEDTIIKQYVDGYVNVLAEMGLNVINGTVLSIQEFGTLCNNDSIIENDNTDACPNYLFETSYWLGNAFNGLIICNVDSMYNAINYSTSFDSKTLGVRPVINITLN